MAETNARSQEAQGSDADGTSYPTLLNRLNWVIICVGVLLRVAQYAANRALWLDESMLAVNIVDRSYTGLLPPLDNSQAAPVPFLMIEKFLIQTLGNSEYALRLFPLLCGIASMFLLYFVAKRVLKPESVPVALGLFALGGPLIYYSSEVKQYSTDVAVVLALYAVALVLAKPSLNAKRIFLFAALAAVAVWFSHPALFVTVAIALGWAWTCRRDKRNGQIAIIAAALALPVLSFGVQYLTVLSSAVHNTWLASGYRWMPFPPKSIKDLYWLVWNFLSDMTDPGGLRFVGLASVCFFVGIWSMYRENRERAYMFFLPGLFALMASGLHRYPFFTRLLLFLVPAMLFFIAQGAVVIKERLGAKGLGIWALMIALLFFHPAFFALQHVIQPRTRNEIKPVLAYLRDHRQKGDVIYVDYASQHAVKYYAARYGLAGKDYVIGAGGVKMGKYQVGRGDVHKWADYINDLDKLRGNRRVWLVFCWANLWNGAADEPQLWLYHLNTVGVEKEEFRARGASVFLYDLSPEAAKKAVPSVPEKPVVDPGYVE